MNIRAELMSMYISDTIKQNIDRLVTFDTEKIIDTEAIKVLSKIKEIVGDETLSDFDAMEEIVKIMESHNISCGGRHDF